MGFSYGIPEIITHAAITDLAPCVMPDKKSSFVDKNGDIKQL